MAGPAHAPGKGGADAQVTARGKPMATSTDFFPFRRGSNLGGWLSPAKIMDEEHQAGFYRRDHIARLARAGANHLRLPVDYELIKEPEAPHRLREQGMEWVEQAINWARAEGLGVTLGRHKYASMSFFTPESNGLCDDAGLQRRFADTKSSVSPSAGLAPSRQIEKGID